MRFSLLLLFALFLAGCSDDQNDVPVSSIRQSVLSNAVVTADQSFSLDLDDDSEVDFTFTTSLANAEAGILRHFRVVPARENGVLDVASGPAILVPGSVIQNGNPFETSPDPLASQLMTDNTVTWSGRWKDVTNGIIGLRFVVNGRTHYGWVRLSFDVTAARYILHEVAWNTKPEGQIRAGLID